MSFWDRFLEELRELGELLVEWAVLIVAALLVLLIGRWILRLVRSWIEKLLNIGPMDTMWERSGVNRALQPSGQTAASITATVVYAWLLVGLWLVVFRILRLGTLEDLLERLLAWIPTLILAAIIVIVSAAVASWVADLVRPFADTRRVPWVTWAIQIAIIVFGVLFAMNVLEVTFAEDITKIVVAAGGIALAVAFGVGGIDTAKLWWARYAAPGVSQREAQRHTQPGQDM